MNSYLKTEMLPIILLDTVSLMFHILSQCLRHSVGVKLLKKLQTKYVPSSSCTTNKLFYGLY